MQRKNNRTVNLTFSALMTALAIILSYFPEIPLVFFAPWLKLDFSFTPLLLLGLSVGPGMMIIALIITNIVHILGGTTGGVGELANMIVGLAFLLPPAFLYNRHKTRVNALIGMGIGLALMIFAGVLANRYVLLPTYFGPGFENALNGMNMTLNGYLFGAIAPFNLVKGFINCIVVFALYKRLSMLMKEVESDQKSAVRIR